MSQTQTKRSPKSNKTLEAALSVLAKPTDFTTFVAGVGVRDRTNLDKHLAALEANPAHARLWQRLVSILGTLAPMPVQTVGQQAIQFFVADGKYRMQAFALEDQRDGKVIVYAPDAVEEAVEAGLISPVADEVDEELDEPREYAVGGKSTKRVAARIRMEQLTASNTPNPPAFVKNMLGWNRKAVRVLLPVDSNAQQLEAVEGLCALGAQQWASKLAAAAAIAPQPAKKG